MGGVCATQAQGPGALSFYEISAQDIDGKMRNMSEWKGKVILSPFLDSVSQIVQVRLPLMGFIKACCCTGTDGR